MMIQNAMQCNGMYDDIRWNGEWCGGGEQCDNVIMDGRETRMNGRDDENEN
jgi:hypothetical protein